MFLMLWTSLDKNDQYIQVGRLLGGLLGDVLKIKFES